MTRWWGWLVVFVGTVGLFASSMWLSGTRWVGGLFGFVIIMGFLMAFFGFLTMLNGGRWWW